MKKLLILFTLLNCLSAFAQDFEVAPVVMKFKVEPGAIGTQKITLRNHGDKKQVFTFLLGDYEMDSLGMKKRMAPGTSKRSCADWISINPAFVELNPNEVIQVEILMAVPNDGYDSRWGMIYVQATQEQPAFEVDKVVATGIKITPRIAVMVSQSPKSNRNYKAKVGSFTEITTEKHKLRTFRVEIINIGDKQISGKIQLIISNIQTGEEQVVAEKSDIVFPDSKKYVEIQLPDDLEKGKYALAVILDYGHGSALEGAQLIIDY